MGKKRTRSSELQLVIDDHDARTNGANKKKFHIKDLYQITPITQQQKQTFYAYNSNFNLFLTGTAGTGKTFIGMYLGLRDVLDESTPYRKLIIIRSAVPTREIGFLPGDQNEKMEIYEQPYIDICDNLFKYTNCYKNLKLNNYVEFMSSSFLRGLTFDNAIILVDEMQNMTGHELNSIITRVGNDSKIIFCGDMVQTDLNKSKNDQSGLGDFSRIIERMSEFSVIRFTIDDIVRSGSVRNYLIHKEKLGIEF